MRLFVRCLASFALLGMLVGPGLAQRRHDPLNRKEIDDLRETAQEPDQRLKLLVKYARARLTTLEQMRNDPKVADRTRQTHDLLQDFLDIYDELDDNLDMYLDRKEDIRKPLHTIIEADTEFQAKLRALRDSADSGKDDAKQYQFVLSNALDAVDHGADDHRQLLAAQEEAAKHRKKK